MPSQFGAALVARNDAKAIILKNHYTHRFPSGWTRCYAFGDVLAVFSIPANKNLEPFLFSQPVGMRELARLWAPDGHHGCALTQALAAIVRQLRRDEPSVRALVSFADPNQNHHGGVYQAASWLYTGQSTESRSYCMPDGTPISRRAFHSGNKMIKIDVPVTRTPGKLRYVRCLDKHALRHMRLAVLPYPKPIA